MDAPRVWTAILVGVGLVAGATVVIVLYHRNAVDRDTLEFGAAIVAGGMAIFGALFALLTVSANSAQARSVRSLEIVDQLNKTEIVLARLALDKELDDTTDVYSRITQDLKRHANATHLLGVFEDLAQAIKAGVADEQVLHDSLGFMVPHYHDRLASFIAAERTVCGDDSLYENLEALVSHWKQGKSYRRGRRRDWIRVRESSIRLRNP